MRGNLDSSWDAVHGRCDGGLYIECTTTKKHLVLHDDCLGVGGCIFFFFAGDGGV